MSWFKRAAKNCIGCLTQAIVERSRPEFGLWRQAGYVKIPHLLGDNIEAVLILRSTAILDWHKAWMVGYLSENGIEKLVFDSYDALARNLNIQLAKALGDGHFHMVEDDANKFTLATHIGGVAALWNAVDQRPKLTTARRLFDAKLSVPIQL